MRHPETNESVAVFKRDGMWPWEYALLGQCANDDILRKIPIQEDIVLPVPASMVRAREVNLLLEPEEIAAEIAVEILTKRAAGEKISDSLVVM